MMTGGYVSNKESIKKLICMLLVSPVLAAFGSLRIGNKGALSLSFVILYFCVGYCFLFKNKEIDSYQYYRDFLEICKNKHSYSFYISEYFNGQYKSLIDLLLERTVAFFSHDIHILFAIIGGCYGYFHSKVFLSINRNRFYKSWHFVVFALFLLLLSPFTNINGFRFYLSLLIFFVALVYKEKIGLLGFILLMILCLLTHISYAILLPLLFVCLIWRRFSSLFVYVCIASYLFLLISHSGDFSYLLEYNNFDGALGYTIRVYLGENQADVVNEANASRSLLFHLYRYFCYFYIPFLLLFVLKIKNIRKGWIIQFFFLLMLFCNITDVIPSFGRFRTLLDMLFIYLYANGFFGDICRSELKLSIILLLMILPMIYLFIDLHLKAISFGYFLPPYILFVL